MMAAAFLHSDVKLSLHVSRFSTMRSRVVHLLAISFVVFRVQTVAAACGRASTPLGLSSVLAAHGDAACPARVVAGSSSGSAKEEERNEQASERSSSNQGLVLPKCVSRAPDDRPECTGRVRERACGLLIFCLQCRLLALL